MVGVELKVQARTILQVGSLIKFLGLLSAYLNLDI
jgi:hypothetical protein